MEELCEFDLSGNKNTIYQNKEGKVITNRMSDEILSLLDYKDDDLFQKYYVRNNK